MTGKLSPKNINVLQNFFYWMNYDGPGLVPRRKQYKSLLIQSCLCCHLCFDYAASQVKHVGLTAPDRNGSIWLEDQRLSFGLHISERASSSMQVLTIYPLIWLHSGTAASQGTDTSVFTFRDKGSYFFDCFLSSDDGLSSSRVSQLSNFKLFALKCATIVWVAWGRELC